MTRQCPKHGGLRQQSVAAIVVRALPAARGNYRFGDVCKGANIKHIIGSSSSSPFSSFLPFNYALPLLMCVWSKEESMSTVPTKYFILCSNPKYVMCLNLPSNCRLQTMLQIFTGLTLAATNIGVCLYLTGRVLPYPGFCGPCPCCPVPIIAGYVLYLHSALRLSYGSYPCWCGPCLG